jgi:hypothetical protein
MDDRVEELCGDIKKLLLVNEAKEVLYLELFMLCLKYLKHPTESIPNRLQLIETLEQLLANHPLIGGNDADTRDGERTH